MTCECVREQEVMEAATIGQWPDRADADLRAHVSSCAICADVAEIAPLFIAERDAAWQEAEVPPASAVFWRAQMRVRREAAEQAARPMVLVQRAALAYAGAALFGLGIVVGPWIRASARAAAALLQRLAPGDDALVGVAMNTSIGLLPIVALSLLLLLAPVALYFARADR